MRELWRSVLLIIIVTPIATAQYAGSQACKGCHAAKFESQSKTAHARALALAPPGSPGHWAFGAGAKAITYVSQADQDAYVEHGLIYYPRTKTMAPTPGLRPARISGFVPSTPQALLCGVSSVIPPGLWNSEPALSRALAIFSKNSRSQQPGSQLRARGVAALEW